MNKGFHLILSLMTFTYTHSVFAVDDCSVQKIVQAGKYTGCKTTAGGKIHTSNAVEITELGCESFCRSLSTQPGPLINKASYYPGGSKCSSTPKLFDGYYGGCKTIVNGFAFEAETKALSELECKNFCNSLQQLKRIHYEVTPGREEKSVGAVSEGQDI